MKRFLTYFMLLVFAIVVGCSKQSKNTTSANNSAAKGEPIVIGAILAYTGPASFLGEPEKKTLEMMTEKINKAGGVLGRQIKVIIKDTGAKPQKAKNAIKELVQKDGAIAILGPTTSGVTLSIKNEMNNMKTPLIACAAREDIVVPVEKSHWIFKTPQSDRMAIDKIFSLMKKRGISKIGLISADKGFGLGGGQQAYKLAPNYGITILTYEKYSASDPDFTTQLTKIKSKNPQAILCWDTNKGSAKVAKGVKALGIKVPLFMSHGMANKGFLNSAGDAGEGVIFPCGRLIVVDQLPDSNKQKKLLSEYTSEYLAKYKENTNTFGGHAYDAITILMEAIKRAGSTDKSKIRDAIETITNFEGTGGIFNFSKTDHNGLDSSAFAFITVKDGKWKLMSE